MSGGSRALSESDLRGVIRDWLVKNGITPREEYQTGAGPADLYLGGYRTIIEVKTGQHLRNGPHAPGSGRDEGTAFEQLSRYVEADRNRGQTRLDEDRDAGWVGCVTDSEHWWVWTWPAEDYGEPQKFPGFDGTVPGRDGRNLLLEHFKRGTQWAPPNPLFLFEQALRDLERLYVQRKNGRETRIQRQLWFEHLRASGSPPDAATADDLFVRHTLLILISRLVSDADDTAAGFVQWVPEDRVLPDLQNIVARYDWRNETGDILRSLYMEMIDPQNRVVFGEFYTPDWLAEKLCRDTIDDEFIREQLDNHTAGKTVHGVLDPACGSGTFLYHAARRILHSEPLKTSYLNDSRKREFVLLMINGLDIHPVAVEMARANMGRVFPGAPADEIHIYQGDSLLIDRPDTGLHSLAWDALTVFTPGGKQFSIPNNFLPDVEGIRTFVMSARDNQDMPAGLGRLLSKQEQAILAESHSILRDVICREGNGVWAWYIQNQASGILLRSRKVGRIVSNPPWVRFNKIHGQKRKDEMKLLAQNLGLWVGGRVSTSFDIAQLFVIRCSDLFLMKDGWSSWVLPHGALYGDAWRNLREKKQIREQQTGRWHLGRLPFPNTPTCVLFLGPEQNDGKLVKMRRGLLDPSLGWTEVESVTELQDLHTFPEEPSSWFDNGRPLAKEGATLVPYCFVKIDRTNPDGTVTTVRSEKLPWRNFGAQTGRVPPEWIHECLFFSNLMPYHIPNTTPCILPIVRGDWDPDRLNNDMYRHMYDTYAEHHGLGESTPATLEGRYNYNNVLFEQFKQTGSRVIYNTSGDNLFAARTNQPHIIDAKLFSVPCKSGDEALFLSATLNAPTLLEAFCTARQSDRDFVAHIWRKIPIPRYDNKNDLHRALSKLARRAEKTAARTYDPSISEKKNRNRIREALAQDGVSGDIDAVVRKIFPSHVA